MANDGPTGKVITIGELHWSLSEGERKTEEPFLGTETWKQTMKTLISQYSK